MVRLFQEQEEHQQINMSELTEKSKVSLDIKAMIGAVIGIISIASVWFTLTAEIAQLQLTTKCAKY